MTENSTQGITFNGIIFDNIIQIFDLTTTYTHSNNNVPVFSLMRAYIFVMNGQCDGLIHQLNIN